MSVKRPQCECCQRIRKPSLQVTRCTRCGKYVCVNANCRVPHAAGTCGDQFANAKARALANDVPLHSFAPKDAFDPPGFDAANIVNLSVSMNREIGGVVTNVGKDTLRFFHVGKKQC